jgi:hypothetical protein
MEEPVFLTGSQACACSGCLGCLGCNGCGACGFCALCGTIDAAVGFGAIIFVGNVINTIAFTNFA